MSLQLMMNNFPALLLGATVVSGAIYAADALFLKQRRRRAAALELAQFDASCAQLTPPAQAGQQSARAALLARLNKVPAWIDYSGSLFPAIAAIFVLRSFLFEPFEIPSESMLPTLMIGDRILVNKFAYGVRLPVINKKIFATGEPQRGDVMVFRSPRDLSVNLVKRVVGVPGDRIVYADKRLTINGRPLRYQNLPDRLDDARLTSEKQYEETLGTVRHRILNDPAQPPYLQTAPDDFPQHELCNYDSSGFACTVPAGQYFMMGDNRDNSLDSRYWGFAPDRNIVGKALFIWMNLRDLSHIGGLH